MRIAQPDRAGGAARGVGDGSAMSTPSPTPKLPVSLAANPRLSSWVKLTSNGRVAISPGKVEIGQGIVTALAQIAADELDVDIGRVEMIRASTAASPNEGVTSGSLSIQQSGRALRQACAEVRQIFVAAAAERLGVDASALGIEDGMILGPGNVRTSYWELAGDVSLDRDATGNAAAKPIAARNAAGHSLQRIDIPDKVFARPRFIHDSPLAGMLHGRVMRPEISGAKLVALDEEAAHAVPGLVAIVRDGSFAGVVSETEDSVEVALKALRKGAKWSDGAPLPDEDDLAAFLKSQPVESTVIDTRTSATPGKIARTIRRHYTRPYIAHASIAPSCAMARWDGDRLHVWTHSQGVYLLRADLAIVLKLPAESITVEHMEGAGCYGHNAADDVALDAALLARAANGRPVRVQWSRHDEMSHAPFGAAMAIEIEADLDADNEIVGWRHSIWSNGHAARPGRAAQPALLAATEIATPYPRMISSNPPAANGGGGDRNSVPLYDFPAWTIESHRLLTMPVRTSALRTLGGQGNIFAIESLLDEIAALRGEDPVQFRLRHLRDERAKDVVRTVAARAKWKPEKRNGVGYGVGFARYKNTGAYCAAIAEIEGTDDIRVRRLILAVDVGEAINPDGVINQIEGGAIQATSWVLKERVRFDRTRIMSTSWTDYPILTFSEVPMVDVEIIQRPEIEPVGAGEAAHGPVTAAIANAVFDGLGVRVRDLPITRDRLIAAMELTP
ncbi:molybdopterin-dependent oxidoreductase [Bradyrhizobium arachidis]|nr:molybdopterin-dependent oxidoreductase [Bradyrhizobium arachidis]